MLTAYQGKPNKNVLLLSSLHTNVKTGNNDNRKPDPVAFYISTKFGVNVLDQMARQCSAKPPSTRWSIQLLFNILNMAALIACILYMELLVIKAASVV